MGHRPGLLRGVRPAGTLARPVAMANCVADASVWARKALATTAALGARHSLARAMAHRSARAVCRASGRGELKSTPCEYDVLRGS